MADIVLILVLFLFTLWGIKRGFISSLLGVASTIVSFLLTTLLYKPVARILFVSPVGDFAQSLIATESELPEAVSLAGAKIIVDVIAFLLVIILVKIVLSVFTKIGKLASKIPVVKQADKLLGGILGLVSGVVFSYIVICIIVALGENDIMYEAAESIQNSSVASAFASFQILK